HVHGLVVDGSVERQLVDPLSPFEEAAQRAWVDDRAGKEVRARRLALLEHRDRDFPEAVPNLRRALEQLAETNRARQAGRAGADDQHADLDPLAFRIRRCGDVVAHAERRRKIGGSHSPLRCFTSSVSLGTTWCTSPTTPRSENSKIGAFGSLLIAVITPDALMPTLCWIAPGMEP